MIRKVSTPIGGRQAPLRKLIAGALAPAAIAAGLGCGAVADGGAASDGEPAADGPNVIVLMTDDQTPSELAAMPRTERRLGARGVRFERSFASFPLCCPSRVTLLTGQLAHNHGVLSNKASEGGGYPGYDDSDSLPVTLQAAGYRTGFVGKYLNNYELEDVPPGWDRWVAKKGPLFDYELNVDGEVRHYGDSPAEYQTDVTAEQATRFISESAEEEAAFFLYVAFFAPHGERGGDDRVYDPRPAPRHRGAFLDLELPEPPSFDEADVSDKPSFVRETPRLSAQRKEKLTQRVRSRPASLLAVDEAVAAILSALRESGAAGSTYVLFTSDHGYMVGEHRQTKKTLLYEESLRTPLLLAGPGVPAGKTRGQLVSNVDLAATIYDVTGVEPGRPLDGASLLPVARDPERGTDRDLLIENRGSAGVRAPGWVYIEHDTDDDGAPEEYELYDLRADPFQLQNLLDPGSGRLREPEPRAERELRRLDARLEELRDCEGVECR